MIASRSYFHHQGHHHQSIRAMHDYDESGCGEAAFRGGDIFFGLRNDCRQIISAMTKVQGFRPDQVQAKTVFVWDGALEAPLSH
jgi:hypothetical protein